MMSVSIPMTTEKAMTTFVYIALPAKKKTVEFKCTNRATGLL